MSNLKNSPFGKRLRASQADPPDDSEGPRRNKPRTNAIPTSASVSASNTPSPRTLPSLAHGSNLNTNGNSNPLVFSVAPSPDTTNHTPGGASTGSAFTFDTRQTTLEPESPGPSTSAAAGRSASPSRGQSSALGGGLGGIGAMGMGMGIGGSGMGGPGGAGASKRDYGDRFVPSRDTGDMRTSYNLMDEPAGPSTPSKTKIIPTESDAVKGELFLSSLPSLSCLASLLFWLRFARVWGSDDARWGVFLRVAFLGEGCTRYLRDGDAFFRSFVDEERVNMRRTTRRVSFLLPPCPSPFLTRRVERRVTTSLTRKLRHPTRKQRGL